MRNRHNILRICALLFASLWIGGLAFYLLNRDLNIDLVSILIFFSGLPIIGGLWLKQRWALTVINSILSLVSFVYFVWICNNVRNYSIQESITYITPLCFSLIFMISALLFLNNKGVIAEFDRNSDDKYDFEE